MATIVIPAHNEAAVIGRTLDCLADGTLRPGTRVVVACNGCTDDTVAIARGFSDRLAIDVLDLDVRSKQAALNGADEHLAGLSTEDGFPRIYLDADISAPAGSLNAVIDVLERGDVLAARPPLRYLTEGTDRLVTGYFRARTRTPQVLQALWGAGVYAVSAQGRERWGAFPLSAPDDLFVDSRFTAPEKTVLADVEPVRVVVPRTTKALFGVLKRVYRPSEDVVDDASDAPGGAGGTLKALLVANSRSPQAVLDALAYVGLAVGARIALKLERDTDHSGGNWERDDTSR